MSDSFWPSLAFLFSGKRERKWLIAIYIGVPLCICLAFLWSLRPYQAVTHRWTGAYDIVGGEHQQFWTIKYGELTDLINESLPPEQQVSYLREPAPSSSSVMLSNNGETWTFLISIFPETAADSYTWKRYEDADQWLGNVEKVQVSLSRDPEKREENMQYARLLIGIFTPGAEDYVAGHLSLSAPPSQGYSRVLVDNVVYTVSGEVPVSLWIEPVGK